MRELSSIQVWLQDGNSAMAVKEGKLNFGNGLCLEHVLFVHNMTCTLISVSKFTKELHCSVTFTNALYVILKRVRNGTRYMSSKHLSKHECVARVV